MDLERSRDCFWRNLGSLEPWFEVVGDDGEGDVRDGLLDIVVVGGKEVSATAARE